MTPEDHGRRAKQAFEQIVELEGAEREAALAALDGEVRREVEELLFHDGSDWEIPKAEGVRAAGEELDGLPAEEWKNRRLGSYQLIRELGRGGSSTVFLARRADDLYDKLVAIKILNQPLWSEAARKRFRRELQILARLDHQSIVRMLEAGSSEEGMAFIVTELVEGVRIDSYAAGLPLRERLRLVAKVSDGMAAAHRNQILHRDLKPQNILVTADGMPKILDFGVALLMDAEGSFTETGQARLTLSYASPEQISTGTARSTASDIFSLGVILYELVCGRRPFQGESPHAVMDAILRSDPELPSRLNGGATWDLDAVCMKMLRKDPAERYQTMEEVKADLEALLAGRPVSAKRAPPLRRARHHLKAWRSRLAWGLATGAIAVAAGVLLQTESRRSKQNLDHVLNMVRKASVAPGGARTSETLLHRMMEARTILENLLRENPGDDAVRRQLRQLLFELGTMLAHPAQQNVSDTGTAVAVLEEAVDVATELHRKRPNHAEDATAYSRTKCALGSIYIEQGRYDDAKREFEQARAANFETSNRDDTERQRSAAYADALANLSRISLHNGQRQECLSLRKTSLEIRRRIMATAPEEVWTRNEVAGALAVYGWALREYGYFKESLAAYEESLAMGLLNLNGGKKIEDVNLEWYVGRNFYELGRVWLALGDRRKARENFKQGLKTFERVQIVEPGSISNLRVVALTLSYLAELTPQRAARRKMAQQALEAAERAAKVDPRHVKAQQEMEEVRQRVARALAVPR